MRRKNTEPFALSIGKLMLLTLVTWCWWKRPWHPTETCRR